MFAGGPVHQIQFDFDAQIALDTLAEVYSYRVFRAYRFADEGKLKWNRLVLRFARDAYVIAYACGWGRIFATRAEQVEAIFAEIHSVLGDAPKPELPAFYMLRHDGDEFTADAIPNLPEALSDEFIRLAYGDDAAEWMRTFGTRATAQVGGLTILEDPPGTGKTSIVSELIRRLKKTHLQDALGVLQHDDFHHRLRTSARQSVVSAGVMLPHIFNSTAMHLTLSKSTIRSFRSADTASITRHIGTYSVARNTSAIPHPYSIQHAGKWIAIASGGTPETQFAIAIDDEVIGGIGLEVGDPGRIAVCDHCAEIGYWLGESFWGRGIMSEAVVALSKWAFTELRLIRLHAAVYARNPASARVLEKAGYEFEGRMRARYFKYGEFTPAAFAAITSNIERRFP